MNRLCLFIFNAALCLCSLTITANELIAVDEFGENPGDIKMFMYVPDNMPDNAALVVSLHGCTQDAKTYAQAGWPALAEQHKFYIVYPQQSPGNNPRSCWNWLNMDDQRRGQGEGQSIVNMVNYMQANFSIDKGRVFIEGLSAGGFLTPVMLANYPDVFVAGATHAGGPAFCARVKQHFWDVFNWWYNYQALRQFDKCAKGIDLSGETWAERLREYGYREYDGEWPGLSIWHGDSDAVVNVRNQNELLEQWSVLLGIDAIADQQRVLDSPDGVVHRQYQNQQGLVLLETWRIPNMSHGTAIDESVGNCGAASDYVLDVDICAMHRIAKFWGLMQP